MRWTRAASLLAAVACLATEARAETELFVPSETLCGCPSGGTTGDDLALGGLLLLLGAVPLVLLVRGLFLLFDRRYAAAVVLGRFTLAGGCFWLGWAAWQGVAQGWDPSSLVPPRGQEPLLGFGAFLVASGWLLVHQAGQQAAEAWERNERRWHALEVRRSLRPARAVLPSRGPPPHRDRG